MKCPICSEWKYRQLVSICPICGKSGGEQEVEDIADDFVRKYQEQLRNRDEDRAAHARGWLPHKVLFCEWPELYTAIHS
jgi:hypothetical protein